VPGPTEPIFRLAQFRIEPVYRHRSARVAARFQFVVQAERGCPMEVRIASFLMAVAAYAARMARRAERSIRYGNHRHADTGRGDYL
jgi:hypothetical protein